MAAVTDIRRVWSRGLLAAAIVALSGCQTVHEVVVDAISNQEKPMGTSYRLEVHDPSGGVDKDLGVQAINNVREALADRGLYEAPAGTRPDMVIELEYGVGPGQIKIVHRSHPIDLGGMLGVQEDYGDKPIMVFEKYISLSAREPAPAETAPTSARKGKRGEELWNLHVSVEDQKKELAPYLPVLASVSIDYMGENSVAEKRIPVKADDAAISLHRNEARPAPGH